MILRGADDDTFNAFFLLEHAEDGSAHAERSETAHPLDLPKLLIKAQPSRGFGLPSPDDKPGARR
jgi:hypothetical protein